jgi:hypothetical protein
VHCTMADNNFFALHKSASLWDRLWHKAAQLDGERSRHDPKQTSLDVSRD